MERRANEQMEFGLDTVKVFRAESVVRVSNIQSDSDSGYSLGLYNNSAAAGDIFVFMEKKIQDGNIPYLPSLRLRSLFGGGFNPFITEGFGSILYYFNLSMREDLLFKEGKRKERLNSNTAIKIEKGVKEKLTILGIQDDDGNSAFIDIFVLKSGDVRLRIRDEKESTGEMLF